MTDIVHRAAAAADLTSMALAIETTSRMLAVLGWEVRAVEVDAVRGRVDITLARHDGRWVHLRADERGATVDRWSRSFRTGKGQGLKTGARVPMSDHVEDFFLGRIKAPTMVAGFRALAEYVGDNQATSLPPGAAREALRPFLGAIRELTG